VIGICLSQALEKLVQDDVGERLRLTSLDQLHAPLRLGRRELVERVGPRCSCRQRSQAAAPTLSEVSFPAKAPAQVEHANTPMPGDELPQRHIHGLSRFVRAPTSRCASRSTSSSISMLVRARV
jgi:hypothetical protein